MQVFISTKSIHHEQEVSKQIPGSLICFYRQKTAVHYNNYCTQLTPWQIVPIVLHEMELEIVYEKTKHFAIQNDDASK